MNNKPPMIAIAAQRSNGKRKDTAINIEKQKNLLCILQMNSILKISMRRLHL